ncbi:MAG: BrnT family toxin [Nitrospirota bacterium]
MYTFHVQFEWDEAKRAGNLAKHGIDFVDAMEMFAAPMFVKSDERKDYGEPRWQGLGIVQGRLMVVAYTKREPNTVRIISLRKANRREKDFYQDAIKD